MGNGVGIRFLFVAFIFYFLAIIYRKFKRFLSIIELL
jgi:hypothetical protein